jgi:hypothetical protein
VGENFRWPAAHRARKHTVEVMKALGAGVSHILCMWCPWTIGTPRHQSRTWRPRRVPQTPGRAILLKMLMLSTRGSACS